MDIIKPSPKDICESIENSIDSISENIRVLIDKINRYKYHQKIMMKIY